MDIIGDLEGGGDSERLLEAFGYGANIPSSAKRRLQHSLSLARKGIELEHRCNELKTSLFKERDERKAIQEELEGALASLSLSKYPTSALIKLVGRRDAEIRKLKSEINLTRESEEKLKKIVIEMEKYKTDIEETVKELAAATSNVQCINEVSQSPPPPPQVKRKVTFKSPPSIASAASSKSLPSSARSSNSQPISSVLSNIAHGLRLKKPLTLSKVPIPKDLIEN